MSAHKRYCKQQVTPVTTVLIVVVIVIVTVTVIVQLIMKGKWSEYYVVF